MTMRNLLRRSIEVWKSDIAFTYDEPSKPWLNNMKLINEATRAEHLEYAQIVATMEVSRQLDRIANALEAHEDPALP